MKDQNKLIVFRIDKQQFALYLPIIERIVRIVEISPLPKAPDYIMGVIDYKGILIPVVNVRNMFGMPEKEVDLNDQLIIANTSTRTLALWVDKVLDVIEQDEKEISKAEKFFVGAEFIKGIFKFEDGMVLIHDLDQFLTAKEISLLKAALNKEKERKREFPEKKKPDEIKKKSEAKVKATTKVKSIKRREPNEIVIIMSCRIQLLKPIPKIRNFKTMPKPQLIELRKHLLNNLGLNFTESREEELYKKIGFAAKEFNYKNTNAFINWIANNNLNPNQIEKLAAFLTIGETYFLREIKALDYLEHTYLPDLIYKRRGKNQRLRIWCAGCSSGEEPYSIAIILKKVIPDIKNWNITILATDINATFLEKARTGIYTKWSFRGIPESFKTENFKEFGKDKFQINPEIQRMVTFSYQNLAKDTYPSLVNNTNAMDIILCRNVLIYFSDKGIKQVTTRLYNCLTKEGILVVSPVEMSNLISPKFSRIQHNGITIYKKIQEKLNIRR